MKRLLFVLAFAFLIISVSAQDREFKKAVNKGVKDSDGIYTAELVVAESDFNKWSRRQKKYVVIGTSTEDALQFGVYTTCVTKARFMPIGEWEAYEKRIATTMRQRVDVKRKYPDYTFSDLSGKGVAESFLFVGDGLFDFSYQLDEKLLVEFLEVFPEYKLCVELQDMALKYNMSIPDFLHHFGDKDKAMRFISENGLGRLSLGEYAELFGRDAARDYVHSVFDAQGAKDIRAEDVIAFVKMFGEYTRVERYICDVIVEKNVKLNPDWVNNIIPHLRGHISLEYIDRLMAANDKNTAEYEARIDAIVARWNSEDSAYKSDQCSKCSVDIDKTTFPYTHEGVIFTSERPGYIYMKSGDKYEFWQDKGKWQVVTGFMTDEKFDSFDEMLNYFVKECQRKYCNN